MLTPEVIARSLEVVRKGNAQYEYFFESLSSPEWIIPLARAGFFRQPPPPRRDGDTVSFPRWPESRYLARMAARADAARDVLAVALTIPVTDNVLVHEDVVDIGCGLPPSEAARLVTEKLVGWTLSRFRTLLPAKLGNLIAHLADGGQASAALDLARATLQLVPDPRWGGGQEDDDFWAPRPRTLVDEWGYGELVQKHGPSLVRAAGVPGLALLCELLASATRFSRRADDDDPQDYSEVWRPDIASDSTADRVLDVLTSAVRDAAIALLERDDAALRPVVEELRRWRWLVFDRVALHVMARFGRNDRQATWELLLDNGLLQRLPREYVQLARQASGDLDESGLQALLRRIEEGPEVERLRAWFRGAREAEPTEEEVQQLKREWQHLRLSAVAPALTGTWREWHEALVREFGEHDALEPMVRTRTWIGPTSPRSGDDLRAMAVPDLVEMLRTWSPERGPEAPSPEGLGRVLAAVIEGNPAPYAESARQFVGLDPTYVRTLLEGLREAAKKGQRFPWSPVIDVMEWLLRQPMGTREQDPGWEERDPGWGWARTAACRLISAGLQPTESRIPFEARERVWRLIATLVEDPDPTPEDEARFGGSNMDPLTLSINTTRGEAMHAVMRYCLWVCASGAVPKDEAGRVSRALGAMPEAREVLERRLVPAGEPSLAVRAVYGKWYPTLAWLDHDWARAQVELVFPTGPADAAFFWAAWDAYVVFGDPSAPSFELLAPVYRHAIGALSSPRPEQRLVASPKNRLAEHLAVMYVRGDLGRPDEVGLLAEFYANADDQLCGHLMSFLGRILAEQPRLSPDACERLKALWAHRLEVAQRSADPKSHAKELEAFGWWLGSPLLDDAWVLRQVELALDVSGDLDGDHLVAKRLVALSASSPRACVACLSRLLDADTEGWRLLGWESDVKEILKAGLSSQDTEARSAAEALIHRLGARGYWGFRSLLEGGREPE